MTACLMSSSLTDGLAVVVQVHVGQRSFFDIFSYWEEILTALNHWREGFWLEILLC
jgi:hypothetical protein